MKKRFLFPFQKKKEENELENKFKSQTEEPPLVKEEKKNQDWRKNRWREPLVSNNTTTTIPFKSHFLSLFTDRRIVFFYSSLPSLSPHNAHLHTLESLNYLLYYNPR